MNRSTIFARTAGTSCDAYVSAFVARHSHLIADCSTDLLEFLSNSHRLCSVMSLPPGSAYAGTPEFDAMIPSFINGLPADARRDVFHGKLLAHPGRREKILSFLNKACSESPLDINDVELIDVTDLSTGRARVPGHVVYKVDLLLRKSKQVTLYFKGFGSTEYRTLTESFDGWENRAQMHRYEAFAQAAANLAGVSNIRSEFYLEPHDANFVGFTLVQAIPGAHSSVLFRSGETTEIKPEYLRQLDVILPRLASWHALSDLIGKADRRFVQLNKGYNRSTNYLVEPDSLSIEGFDHEYIFAPPSLVRYELEQRHSEMAILATLPAADMPAALLIYATSYVSAWNRIVSGQIYNDIRHLASDVFGANSVESSFLNAARSRDPQRSLCALWKDISERTKDTSLAPFPIESTQLERTTP